MILKVIQGSKALNIQKGVTLYTQEPEHQGNGVHLVRIHLPFRRGLYARLVNHPEFNLNNGDPTKKIRVRRLDPQPQQP